jgi:hypothetical protein
MPLTYFAHQLVVIPLKAARPRWFDGTALCIGSMAPDFAYAFIGTPLGFGSHNVPALFFWCLPITLLGTRIVRGLLAEPVGAQLPEPYGSQVRALARSMHSWRVTISSALLGGFSHVLMDSFTHRHGWGYEHIGWLHAHVGAGWQVADVLQYVGHTLGTLVCMLLVARLCAAQRVSAWNGSRDSLSATLIPQPWFWLALALVACVSLAITVLMIARGDSLPVAIIRGSYVAFGALCFIAFGLRREREVVLEP